MPTFARGSVARIPFVTTRAGRRSLQTAGAERTAPAIVAKAEDLAKAIRYARSRWRLLSALPRQYELTTHQADKGRDRANGLAGSLRIDWAGPDATTRPCSMKTI